MSFILVIVWTFIKIIGVEVPLDLQVKVLERPFLNDNSLIDAPENAYKIVVEKEDSIIELDYHEDLQELFSVEERLVLVEQLLRLNKDERTCIFSVRSWGSGVIIFEEITNKYYSIQLEALFLINLIALDQPLSYSSIPVLENSITKEKETISGELIDQAFEFYNIWFELVKERGLGDEAIRFSDPLDGSNIRWLFPR